MFKRTREQLFEHYQIEKELASRLKNADRSARKKLYASLYDELFERVPHHPQLTMRNDRDSRRIDVALQLELLSRFLNPDYTYLEIGCGDCQLLFEVSKYVRKVYGVDVSRRVTDNVHAPRNFELKISDGISIDVPDESIDIAYSHQLMEHLHPDDVLEHLKHVHRILAFGGKYICVTPHRFMGPHDISGYFENEAKGLHLHEYTNGEIRALFKTIGFSDVISYKRVRGHYARISCYPAIFIENLIGSMPHRIRKKMSRTIFKNVLAIRVVATK